MTETASVNPLAAYDFAVYADRLDVAVHNYFSLFKILREQTSVQTSQELDQDTEIDLGITVARLKRDDVPLEEKIERVKSAGKWLKETASHYGETILTAVREHGIEEIVGQIEFSDIQVSLFDSIVDLGALQDRFTEQFEPEKYSSWEQHRERQIEHRARQNKIMQDTHAALHGLADESQEFADKPYLTHLLHSFDHMRFVSDQIDESQSMLTDRYGEEATWRYQNAFSDVTAGKSQQKRMCDVYKNAVFETVPADEHRIRHLISAWHSAMYKELDRMYPTGPSMDKK